MSHIPYTISRSGTFYYNRRTPKIAVESYGPYIRLKLGSDVSHLNLKAARLTLGHVRYA
jgi:hypothetical protein